MSDKKTFNAFDWTMIVGTVLATVLCAIFVMGWHNAVSSPDWWVTSVAGVLNICCCVCSARGNRWTFLFGAIYNTLYTWYCFHTGHYGNAAVYGLCFLPLQLIGWLQWRRIGNAEDSSQVAAKRLSWTWRAVVSCVSVAVMVGLWFALRALGGNDILVDSMCTVLCIIAQLLLTFAYMEQWFIWIGVNVLTLIMWALSAASGNSSLADLNLVICYLFVLVNSINGLRVWLKLSRETDK